MHTLHVDLGREMRGGQHQVLLLLKTLRSAGHSFTLLARNGSPLYSAAERENINVRRASLRALRRLSSEHDVVHAHDAKAHTWAAIVSQRPFVVSRRVAFPVDVSLLSRWKYGRAARYLAVSNFVASKLREAGVPQSRIDIVPDSVEPFSAVSWTQDGPVVSLQTNDPMKGRDLVESAANLAKISVQFSADITKDLVHASAFVYISRSEGFGSAALIAMSMGVPLIASRIDGMIEVFEDGVSGLAVANDPPAIAAAIQRLQADPDLAKSLIANAKHRAESLFSPSALLIKTLASYRRALAI